MVLLFNTLGFVVLFVSCLVLIWFLLRIAQEDKPKTNTSSQKNPEKVSFIVYDKPQVDRELPSDDGENGNYSCSIPKDVEEIELLITEKDGNISADVYSIKHRGNLHEKTIFFDNVDKSNIYKVVIPPDAGSVNLIIKETDHKISVEVESVEKKENK